MWHAYWSILFRICTKFAFDVLYPTQSAGKKAVHPWGRPSGPAQGLGTGDAVGGDVGLRVPALVVPGVHRNDPHRWGRGAWRPRRAMWGMRTKALTGNQEHRWGQAARQRSWLSMCGMKNWFRIDVEMNTIEYLFSDDAWLEKLRLYLLAIL